MAKTSPRLDVVKLADVSDLPADYFTDHGGQLLTEWRTIGIEPDRWQAVDYKNRVWRFCRYGRDSIHIYGMHDPLVIQDLDHEAWRTFYSCLARERMHDASNRD